MIQKSSKSFHAGLSIFLFVGLNAFATETQSFESLVGAGMRPYVDRSLNVGITIGAFKNEKRFSKSYGEKALDRGVKANERTQFQIGSNTKVFTNLVLAELVLEGKLSLHDPISKFFRELVGKPAGAITLLQLATHTSGLPRIPDNLNSKDGKNPYRHYSESDLIAFLSGFKPSGITPYPISYSNTGSTALGLAIQRATNTPYEKLVMERIVRPLGMTDTGFSLSQSQSARAAQGYTSGFGPTPFWDFAPGMGGAGALHSSSRDMLIFMEAQLHPASGPLGSAIKYSHEVKVKGDERNVGIPPNADMGLGWIILKVDGQPFYIHAGQTGGFHSFISAYPAGDESFVMLSNTASTDLDGCVVNLSIGRPCAPIPHSPTISREALDALAGIYVTTDNFGPVVSIDRRRNFLSLGFSGSETRLNYAGGNTFSFPSSNGEVKVEFSRSANGENISMTVTDGEVKSFNRKSSK